MDTKKVFLLTTVLLLLFLSFSSVFASCEWEECSYAGSPSTGSSGSSCGENEDGETLYCASGETCTSGSCYSCTEESETCSSGTWSCSNSSACQETRTPEECTNSGCVNDSEEYRDADSCGGCGDYESCVDGQCCITECRDNWCDTHDDGCGGTIDCAGCASYTPTTWDDKCCDGICDDCPGWLEGTFGSKHVVCEGDSCEGIRCFDDDDCKRGDLCEYDSTCSNTGDYNDAYCTNEGTTSSSCHDNWKEDHEECNRNTDGTSCDQYNTCSSGDKYVVERSYYCDDGSCDEYEDENIENCTDLDGYDCNGDDLVERKYYCDGADCDNYNNDTKKDCVSHYDRGFCTGSYSEDNAECQSYPEAVELDWNKCDHDYDDENCSYEDNYEYSYCGENSEIPSVELSWKFKSSTDDNHQTSYLEVVENEGFGTWTDPNYVIEPVEIEGEDEEINYIIDGSELDYDTKYAWRVKVQDDNDNWSDDYYGDEKWFYGLFETDIKRANPDFEWTPFAPRVNEKVYFEDVSDMRGLQATEWFWTFEDGDPEISEDQNPRSEFSEEEMKEVMMEVTDQDDTVCRVKKDVEVETELPDWEETDPFSMIIDSITRFFALK